MSDDQTPPLMQRAGSPAVLGTAPLHRILVADDDGSMRQLITKVLGMLGHQVDAAEDGLIAWGALQRHSYDLLVTDCDMPRVSGVELVKKVRAARMALPVILVSGLMPNEELRRLPDLQLAATLNKPFTGDELVATVCQALGNHPMAPPSPPA